VILRFAVNHLITSQYLITAQDKGWRWVGFERQTLHRSGGLHFGKHHGDIANRNLPRHLPTREPILHQSQPDSNDNQDPHHAEFWRECCLPMPAPDHQPVIA
jgi:hypothetical protein